MKRDEAEDILSSLSEEEKKELYILLNEYA